MAATAEANVHVDEPTYSVGWRKWIIAFTASMGAILEVIDTSIVNVALPDMQGNLGATLSEIGWVVTGYAIANAIIIPITAWLGDIFGKKRYWLFSLIGFTCASVLCGISHSLPMLVMSRILQGVFGGGLLAKAQSILFETFPPDQQSQAQAIFGIGVIVGPVIGPTLGGYLTDTYNWRWIFFINVPFGIFAVLMSIIFLPDLKASRVVKKIDWLGILWLAVFLGCFQTFLEQGNEYDWFSSRLITTLAVGAIVGFGFWLWHELRTSAPAVDLHVLRHRSLTAGSVYSFILGVGLYGALFAVPVFAQNFLNFTAMQTGMLLLPGALASAAMMPVLGVLTKKIDARLLIGAGAVLTSVCMWMMASINPNTGEQSLFVPLILRGLATSMMFLPLSLASIGPLPRQDIAQASGFYNLMRQLGGSVGVAGLTTLLQWREDFHRTVLVANVNQFNPALQNYMSNMTGLFESKGYDPVHAQQQAYAMVDNLLNQQAAVMSFADIFWLVAIVFLASLPLLFFLGKGRGEAPAGAH